MITNYREKKRDLKNQSILASLDASLCIPIYVIPNKLWEEAPDVFQRLSANQWSWARGQGRVFSQPQPPAAKVTTYWEVLSSTVQLVFAEAKWLCPIVAPHRRNGDEEGQQASHVK